MKFEVETRTRARPPWWCRPIAFTSEAMRTTSSMSKSVSVGWPTMKYILMLVQPLLNACSAALSRSSSVTSLLIVLRSRCEPASGASVSVCFLPRATASATSTENESTRVEGSPMRRPRSP